MQLRIYAQCTRSGEAMKVTRKWRESERAWVKHPKYHRRYVSTWTYRGRASRKLADIRARVTRRILLITRAPIGHFARATHKRLGTTNLSKRDA